MKVSIVVPVYNVAPYIEQFARSVFEQTLEDIEYVFVDDCSPDSSMDILLSVLEEYPHRKQKVKIVRHEKNMGIAVTRKDGYMKSTGEYMIYVDSDDYLEPRMLELMYAKAKEHDADMIVCDIYLYNKENCNVLKTAPKEEGENGEKIKDAVCVVKADFAGVTLAWMRRDELLALRCVSTLSLVNKTPEEAYQFLVSGIAEQIRVAQEENASIVTKQIKLCGDMANDMMFVGGLRQKLSDCQVIPMDSFSNLRLPIEAEDSAAVLSCAGAIGAALNVMEGV